MRIVLYTSYSNNNKEVNDLTIRNHVRYCEKHGYSFIYNNEKYTPTIPVNLVKGLLSDYDYVALVGSDIMFTDFNKPLTAFNLGKLSAAQEHHKEPVVINGDFVICSKDAPLDIINKYQNTAEDGSQSVITSLYKTTNLITNIPELQYPYGAVNQIATRVWQPGDFSIHFLKYGYIPRVNFKRDAITSFYSCYPEYF